MAFDLQSELHLRREQGLLRSVRKASSPQGPEMYMDGQRYLTFCSNDYLGLANHPEVAAAFQKGIQQYGVGSGAAHLINGHTEAHQALEEELARMTGREAAILFSTGYMANIGVITALLNKQDAVFQDKWNHASLLDGGLLSGGRFQRYLHNDVDNLNARLARSEARRKLIVTDGVFSMDGDIAPLPQLVTCAQQHDAWLMVDDAHGFGVLGDSGAGCAEHFQLSQSALPVLMGTLGKAVGTAGAFVAGSQTLIDYLMNFARPYIYTTAMPAAVSVATLASLKIIQHDSSRRQRLQSNIQYFRQAAEQLGLNLMPSHTAIQPILVGDADTALKASEHLKAHGMMVTAIRPPTVPEGTARLRITLSAAHEPHQIDQLLQVLSTIASLQSGHHLDRQSASTGVRK